MARTHAPQRSRAHLVRRIRWTVLHDSVSSAHIVQKEVAVGMNDLASQCSRHGECSAVDDSACGSGRDRGYMTDVATDRGEEVLTGLRITCREESRINRRGLGSAHEGRTMINVVHAKAVGFVLRIGGGLAYRSGIGWVEPVGNSLLVEVSIT